ncbi:hypothetical protein RhiirA4_477575 [Rhizophagus irregularis]|uniref:Uncharacterized protein n=1 Tax=Rhizophagus irregularis TaxID=588596 RepID=A0A2I1HDM5_9GLOM|nr:hypothetical protein RhiirA4_477575 [Rhizophagus irregularis]
MSRSLPKKSICCKCFEDLCMGTEENVGLVFYPTIKNEFTFQVTFMNVPTLILNSTLVMTIRRFS